MADGYAPALFLEALAFWFILRWLLTARTVLLVGRLLVLMMFVGALGAIDEHRFVWAGCFAGSAFLAWLLRDRWRRRVVRSVEQALDVSSRAGIATASWPTSSIPAEHSASSCRGQDKARWCARSRPPVRRPRNLAGHLVADEFERQGCQPGR